MGVDLKLLSSYESLLEQTQQYHTTSTWYYILSARLRMHAVGDHQQPKLKTKSHSGSHRSERG